MGKAPRTGEAADVPVVRARLTEVLGVFGDGEVLADARMAMTGRGGTLATRTAQQIVAAKANTTTFDALLAQARASKDALQRLRIYQALAGVEDEALAQRLVPVLLSGEVTAGTNAQLMVALAQPHPALAWTRIVPDLANRRAAITPNYRRQVAFRTARLLDDPAIVAKVRTYAEREVPAKSAVRA